MWSNCAIKFLRWLLLYPEFGGSLEIREALLVENHVSPLLPDSQIGRSSRSNHIGQNRFPKIWWTVIILEKILCELSNPQHTKKTHDFDVFNIVRYFNIAIEEPQKILHEYHPGFSIVIFPVGN